MWLSWSEFRAHFSLLKISLLDINDISKFFSKKIPLKTRYTYPALESKRVCLSLTLIFIKLYAKCGILLPPISTPITGENSSPYPHPVFEIAKNTL